MPPQLVAIEHLIVLQAMIASFLLSAVYAVWLFFIQDRAIPDLLDIEVMIGVGAICDTLIILERWGGVSLTGWTVVLVALAWGTPIEIWQQYERFVRRKRRRAILEGTPHYANQRRRSSA